MHQTTTSGFVSAAATQCFHNTSSYSLLGHAVADSQEHWGCCFLCFQNLSSSSICHLVSWCLCHAQVEDAADVNQDGDKGSAGNSEAAAPEHAPPASRAAAPSPHEGLSHEQYKKLKRHKKKHQPVQAHVTEMQFTTSCATCGLDCKSRNKLFAHLKSTGHAALK